MVGSQLQCRGVVAMGFFKSLAWVIPVQVNIASVEQNRRISGVFLMGKVEVRLSFLELFVLEIGQASIVIMSSIIWL
jgi:hypothetical protein